MCSGLADELVIITRCVDEVAIVELDLVRDGEAWREGVVAPEVVDDGALGPFVYTFADAAFDGVANGEAQRLDALGQVFLGVHGVHEALSESRVVQVPADEGELAAARLALLPGIGEAAVRDHVDGVEHVPARDCLE